MNKFQVVAPNGIDVNVKIGSKRINYKHGDIIEEKEGVTDIYFAIFRPCPANSVLTSPPIPEFTFELESVKVEATRSSFTLAGFEETKIDEPSENEEEVPGESTGDAGLDTLDETEPENLDESTLNEIPDAAEILEKEVVEELLTEVPTAEVVIEKPAGEKPLVEKKKAKPAKK